MKASHGCPKAIFAFRQKGSNLLLAAEVESVIRFCRAYNITLFGVGASADLRDDDMQVLEGIVVRVLRDDEQLLLCIE